MTISKFWIALAIASAATCSVRRTRKRQRRVKVRFGVLTTASQAAFTVGVQAGIFRKHGFDVEVIPLATGAQANQALAADQVDWSGGGIESTVVAWATQTAVHGLCDVRQGRRFLRHPGSQGIQHQFAGRPARQERLPCRKAPRRRRG